MAQVESEFQQMQPELLIAIDGSSDCPTCPSRPNVGECPFRSGTPEWQNWYEHFGYELVRWSQVLSDSIALMGPNVKSIKWAALRLNGIETELKKEPVALTRIFNVPVFNSVDEGITVTENSDIVTYNGTGILINIGRGVVINAGSGIVINFSNRTCTNTGEGILICFGKSILENSGAGYGIIKTCKVVSAEDRVCVNAAGGLVIKNVGHLLQLYASQDSNCNQNEMSQDESLSDDSCTDSEGLETGRGAVGGRTIIELKKRDSAAEKDDTTSDNDFSDSDDTDHDHHDSDGINGADLEISDDDHEFSHTHTDPSEHSGHENNDNTDSDGTSLSQDHSTADEDSSDDEGNVDCLSSVLDSISAEGLTDIAQAIVTDEENDALDDYNDEVSSLCNSCGSDGNNQDLLVSELSEYGDDDYAGVIMTVEDDTENYLDDMEDIFMTDATVNETEYEVPLVDDQTPNDSPVPETNPAVASDTALPSIQEDNENESGSEGGVLENDDLHESGNKNKTGAKCHDESHTLVRKTSP